MVKLTEKDGVDRRIPKSDHIRFSPPEKCAKDFPYCQISFNITLQDSVISLINSYLFLNFEVIKKTDSF